MVVGLDHQKFHVCVRLFVLADRLDVAVLHTGTCLPSSTHSGAKVRLIQAVHGSECMLRSLKAIRLLCDGLVVL